jgi:F-type H+-transporting ATPase subunit a
MTMLAMWQSHGDSVSEETHDNHAAPDAAVQSAQGGAAGSHDAHSGSMDSHETGQDAHSAGSHDAQADSHDAHAEQGGSKIPELPNLMGVGHSLLHGNPQLQAFQTQLEDIGFNDPNGDAFTAFETATFGMLVVLVLSVFFVGATRKLKVRPAKNEKLNGKAMFTEVIYEYFEDFFGSIVGRDKVRRHLPLIGTLFIYILVCNCLGLIFLGKAPTANLSFNMAMALVVFLYVHGSAIVQSPLGWLKHFPGELATVKEMGPMAYFLGPILAILFTVIHVMELFIQPISLALRLYGNLLGKDVLLGVFAGLVPYVPMHAPFLFLGLLLGAIQALIFSLLSAVYITMWEPHEHHGHHEHADSHA